MSELLDLAARVEAAEGPDRELDGEIWCRLHRPHYNLPTPIEWQRGRPKTPGTWLRAYGLFNGFVSPPKCPAYTSSLDAAMTLAIGDVIDVLLEALRRLVEAGKGTDALPRFVVAAALRARSAS